MIRALNWTCVFFNLTLFIGVQSASAAVFFAANNGLDEAGCGSRKSPCRSISAAYGAASGGDTIMVGPGYYGDLNRDGDFDDEGEERGFSSADALLSVQKLVRIVSMKGALVTHFSANNQFDYAIEVRANGASIGRKRRGLTISGGNKAALYVGGSSFRLLSSRIFGYESGQAGMEVGCPDTGAATGAPVEGRVLNSTFTAEAEGVFLCDRSARWNFRNNHFDSNGSHGVLVEGGSGHRFTNNAMTNNGGSGVQVINQASDLVLTRNVVTGNGSLGLALFDFGQVRNNSIIGNFSVGVSGITDATVTGNNIYGNFPFDTVGGGFSNCGLFTNSEETVFTRNFWGDSAGPGSEPADLVCTQVISIGDVQSLSRERRFRSPAVVQ